jgi:hypothetical protein
MAFVLAKGASQPSACSATTAAHVSSVASFHGRCLEALYDAGFFGAAAENPPAGGDVVATETYPRSRTAEERRGDALYTIWRITLAARPVLSYCLARRSAISLSTET